LVGGARVLRLQHSTAPPITPLGWLLLPPITPLGWLLRPKVVFYSKGKVSCVADSQARFTLVWHAVTHQHRPLHHLHLHADIPLPFALLLHTPTQAKASPSPPC
jgi:hypothetical protein